MLRPPAYRMYNAQEEAPDVLCQAVRRAAKGGIWLSDHSRNKMLVQVSRSGHTEYDLAPHELEVLRLLAQGKSDKEIAATLNMTTRSIRTYVHNILDKLDVHSRVQLLAKASEENLVQM